MLFILEFNLELVPITNFFSSIVFVCVGSSVCAPRFVFQLSYNNMSMVRDISRLWCEIERVTCQSAMENIDGT